MRTTMLHITHELDNETRQQLCATFHQYGVECSQRKPSAKPQLMFVDYDEKQTAPTELVRLAMDAGYPAQVVDI